MCGGSVMSAELTGELFEWLLADWAGYGNEPEQVFPNLLNADIEALNIELSKTILQANPIKQAV